jgi:hypothetical protein
MDATGVNPTSVANIIDLQPTNVPAPAAAVQQLLFNAPSRDAVHTASPLRSPSSPLSSARSPLNLTHPTSCAVSQALECEALKILLQPLIAHPRSDATISNLVICSAACAEVLECDPLEEHAAAASRALYEAFAKFMALVSSHRIFHLHRWWTSFAASASVRPGPSDEQVDSLVLALLQCFQELDAVGELFPPSGLARNFVAEGAFGPSPVTLTDVTSAISDSVIRAMAVYQMQLDINSRVLQKMQVHVEYISSELLDLEAALHATQAGSKSMFARVSNHDRTLDRHAQAISDLEQATFGDQYEEEADMSDDNDFEDDDVGRPRMPPTHPRASSSYARLAMRARELQREDMACPGT